MITPFHSDSISLFRHQPPTKGIAMHIIKCSIQIFFFPNTHQFNLNRKCPKLYFSWFDVRISSASWLIIIWFEFLCALRECVCVCEYCGYTTKVDNAQECTPVCLCLRLALRVCVCVCDNKTELRGNIVQLNCFRNEFSQKPMTSCPIHTGFLCSAHANIAKHLNIWIVDEQPHIHTRKHIAECMCVVRQRQHRQNAYSYTQWTNERMNERTHEWVNE